ncbi:putative elongator complex protein 1 [Rhizina undulata]
MRNLLATKSSRFSVSSTEAPDLPITATAWDASTDSLICAFGPTEVVEVIEIKRIDKDGQESRIASWDVPPPSPSVSCDTILSLHYFPDTLTTCIVLSGGDIVVLQEDPSPGDNKIEIVGSVDEGITAATWSPDDEVLAITTCDSTFLLMTRTFEPIADVAFSEEDLNASKSVNVGWGKSETQFKGKRAKAMRDPTVPEKVDEGKLSAEDDGAARITWRGDGAYLAISTVEYSQRRLIRVYSRDGTLESVSEPVDGLEGALSWKPSGNLIAGVQRFPDRLDIVFFERNGLRHGEFTLRVPPEEVSKEKVYELLWNGDSSVLAICFGNRIQLWTTGNYHWYLKQEIFFPVPDGTQRLGHVVKWHPERPLSFSFAQNGFISRYTFAFTVSSGSIKPPNDYGIVAVIDGGILKLTPLRIANVPPPMAFREVELKSTPINVAVSPDGSKIAVLRRSAVDLVQWTFGKKKLVAEPKVISQVAEISPDGTYRQICFLGNDTLGLLYDDSFGQSVIKVLECEEADSVKQIGELIPNINSSISKLGALPESNSFFYEDQAGVVQLHNWKTGLESSLWKFPAFCPWIETAVIEEQQVLLFGLTETGVLYANDILICSNCTSFMVTSAHLIYTTTQHVLKFIHLRPDIKDFEIPGDDPTGDERCRSIERGARLVQVMPTNFSLTLQMPRGNLETTFPRALVLAGVRRNIEAKDYRTAFLACRSHRVDLNILHDYMPDQFMSNVQLFIEQVNGIEYIDLFLSQLRNEDVSKTMYKETLLPQLTETPAEAFLPESTKVNRICEAFLDVLLATRISTNVQNIITGYVCKLPPDHDSALSLIAKLCDQNIELAEQAIIHVCFLSDVNKLYENALGLYNLELALMVAQQSQKDPREYLPFLQNLQEMETVRRKFFIDNYLGRFSKAVIHLHELGNNVFEEIKDYIVTNELYSVGLALYKYDAEKLKVIMGLYAKFLLKSSRYSEAGLTYEFLEDHTSACEAYRKAGMWQEALFTASQAPYSPSDMDELTQTLVESLSEAKLYEQAAIVHLEYRGDVAEAVRALCKGCHFSEAMRLVTLKGRPEMLESIVDVGLVEAFTQTTELIADCKGQITAQVARLVELRQKKEEDPLAYFEGMSEADAPDNVSLAATNVSTSASLFTRYTGKTGATAVTGATRRTHKNKRREERKRARGKKGSVYEEEYLVNSLFRLIDRLEMIRPETQRLIEGMTRRRMRERALAVQSHMVELVEQVKANAKIIGEPTAMVPRGASPMEGEQKPAVKVIQSFEKLCLL